MNSIVTFYTKEQQIDVLNGEAQMLFGYAEEALQGRSLTGLFPDWGQGPLPQVGKRVDGTLFPCQLELLEGEVISVLICRPLYEDLSSVDELMLLEQFVDDAPTAIAMFDRQMNYLRVTRRWLSEFQLQNQELKGRSHYQVFPLFGQDPEALSRWRRRQQSCLAGNVETGDDEPVRDFQGGLEWYRWEMRPWKTQENEIAGVLLWMGNITHTKVVRDELYEAKESAEAANRSKSTFLANMSHELRTPLNAIIGYSEMLSEEAQEDGYEEIASDLEKIRGAGKHLLSLINDILDISKIEAGRMDLYIEAFDLHTLMLEIEATATPLIEEKENTLILKGDADLGNMYADLTKVRQVLFNLISNAAKFTKNGDITFEIRREVRDERPWITFDVSDTGIGMTSEQLDNIFTAFSQADASTTRKYGGTGLGLAIARHFCQMMGGDLQATSEPQVGSTFRVRLPAEPIDILEDSLDEGPNQEMTSPATGVILVIDDDPDTLDLISRRLTKDGFYVVTAMDGESGLVKARQLHPDAIILDILMEGMSGWNVLSELKADPTLVDIPTIVATILDDRNIGFTLGASDYLVKPVDNQQLTRLLAKYQGNLPGQTSPQRRRILLVEDDDMSREMMRRTLEKLGCNVVEANNGRAALDAVAAEVPHLVLLDLMMPEMDGFGFLAEFRENHQWRTVPVVVVTAMELTASDRQRLDGCVAHILEKGNATREELLHEVRERLFASLNRSPTESSGKWENG
ncbi:response regulator [Geitlerinema sp. P-1104]|uniref:response regulator n=1 Tax=Geitlerinema sp. P-1104 TaxID=2546230 RepID=UPI0014773FFB|nr:response regulator [Geitlerinema sp. P-1104]NMG59241.1 response regulator [Geitlerinema sp. P-1104]